VELGLRVEVGELERWVKDWLQQAIGKTVREKLEDGNPRLKSKDANLEREVEEAKSEDESLKMENLRIEIGELKTNLT